MKTYKVFKQKLKSTKGEFYVYRFLSRMCKKTYNLALANIKYNYEKNKSYFDKYENYGMLKDNEVSLWLNSEVFQKTIYSANEAYESYFKLLKYKKDNHLEIKAKEPNYIKDLRKNLANRIFMFFKWNRMYYSRRILYILILFL